MLQHQGAFLLQQRPEPGIWGGLWSLPEFDAAGDPLTASRALGLIPEHRFELAAFAHTFTHYRLHIRPWYIPVRSATLREPTQTERWIPQEDLPKTALPAPVKKLLLGLVEAGLPGDLLTTTK